MKKGFSLVEILVVVSIFGILGTLSTRSIFLTIRGAKKSDSLVRVRENVNYSLSVIERQIRSAQSITCPNPDLDILDYISEDGISTTFTCETDYIASGSARLTSADIRITDCSLTCYQLSSNTPPSVKISVTAEDTVSTSVEKGSVSVDTEIVARNY